MVPFKFTEISFLSSMFLLLMLIGFLFLFFVFVVLRELGDVLFGMQNSPTLLIAVEQILTYDFHAFLAHHAGDGYRRRQLRQLCDHLQHH